MCKNCKIVIIVSLLVALQVQAQQSSVGVYSPYTLYGIGQLESSKTTAQRAMGQTGVADYSAVTINPRNAASYGRVARNTMLLDMGLCWGNFYQKCENLRKTDNTVNLANVSLVAPLMKNWGVGFDLEPRSMVGYRVKFVGDVSSSAKFVRGEGDEVMLAGDEGDDVQMTPMVYDYQGEGGVTRWALGLGWSLSPRVSVGVEMVLNNCNITNSCTVSFSSLVGGAAGGSDDKRLDVQRSYSYVKMLVALSVQCNVVESECGRLVFGAKYQPEANCRLETQEMIVTGADTVSNVTDNSRLRLPSSWTAGAAWRSSKWVAAVDWEFQRWGRSFESERAVEGEISWANRCVLALGGEFTPNPGDVRNFWNRVTYRMGVRYDSGYLIDSGHRIKTRVVSWGVTLPLKQNSSITVAAEYGRNGLDAGGVIRTDFWNLSVGFSFFGTDDWFKRYRFK